jgi:hypothetical protein
MFKPFGNVVPNRWKCGSKRLKLMNCMKQNKCIWNHGSKPLEHVRPSFWKHCSKALEQWNLAMQFSFNRF